MSFEPNESPVEEVPFASYLGLSQKTKTTMASSQSQQKKSPFPNQVPFSSYLGLSQKLALTTPESQNDNNYSNRNNNDDGNNNIVNSENETLISIHSVIIQFSPLISSDNNNISINTEEKSDSSHIYHIIEKLYLKNYHNHLRNNKLPNSGLQEEGNDDRLSIKKKKKQNDNSCYFISTQIEIKQFNEKKIIEDLGDLYTFGFSNWIRNTLENSELRDSGKVSIFLKMV
ncbi:hypothetical protein Glove_91g74 [Diversispora epigaea]|uniref:Uncharacterized protein n=1 Tax=Diversispora epigaea TaxID=1348612 RepID=A0A397JFX9_9GLOM|nr:hypothetical protein Glove_91g75 [Diversispora epigaea]RHZ83541.1 hypothetical protein Glove_91g74 [Diversispora epigaea]